MCTRSSQTSALIVTEWCPLTNFLFSWVKFHSGFSRWMVKMVVLHKTSKCKLQSQFQCNISDLTNNSLWTTDFWLEITFLWMTKVYKSRSTAVSMSTNTLKKQNKTRKTSEMLMWNYSVMVIARFFINS